MCYLVDALAVRQVWRVDEPCNSSATLRLPKIKSEGRGVSENVATDWLGWVSPHGIRLGVDLICYQNKGIVDIGELLEIFEVTVQLLLPVCKHAATDKFRTEVACKRIDDDHLDIEPLAHTLDFFS